jgi:hypothetical protein
MFVLYNAKYGLRIILVYIFRFKLLTSGQPSFELLHVQYAFLKMSRFTLLVDVVFSNTKIRLTHHLYCRNTFVHENIYLWIIDKQRQSTFRVPCYLYLVPCEFRTECTIGHID